MVRSFSEVTILVHQLCYAKDIFVHISQARLSQSITPVFWPEPNPSKQHWKESSHVYVLLCGYLFRTNTILTFTQHQFICSYIWCKFHYRQFRIHPKNSTNILSPQHDNVEQRNIYLFLYIFNVFYILRCCISSGFVSHSIYFSSFFTMNTEKNLNHYSRCFLVLPWLRVFFWRSFLPLSKFAI